MLRRLLGWPGDTWRFLRAEPVRMGVVVAMFVVGGLAGMPFGEDLYRYTWADSRFCDDCHVHDYANEAWARSVHSELTTCHDCHRVPISHYPHNLWLAAFDRPERGDIERPGIESVICEQCHADSGSEEVLTGPMSAALRREIVHIDRSPLHTLHLESEGRDPGSYRGAGGAADEDSGARTITCLDCHGSERGEAHQFVATPGVCEECHENQVLGGARGAMISCRDCHFAGFLGTVESAPDPP